MRKIQPFVFVALAFSLLVACQKNFTNTIPPPATDSTGNHPDTSNHHNDSTGNHTDTTGHHGDSTTQPVDTVNTSSWNFQPHTTNSSWTYEDSATGTSCVSTASDVTEMFDNITFQHFNDVSANGSVYELFAVSGSNYYQHLSLNVDTFSVNFTVKYLDASAKTGTQWKTTAVIQNIPATITTTVTEKNISKEVNGKIYTGVTHTHTTVIAAAYGFSVKLGDIDYFMAKDIGIIQRSITINGGSIIPDASYQATVNLISYSIK